MQLRDYQAKAIEAVNDNLDKTNKMVWVMATGLGKTVAFSHLIEQRKHLGRALVIAHREELLDQAKDKLHLISPTLRAGIEQAELKTTNKDEVIIASIQTIGRKGSKRIEKFNPKDFKTIIIDECHHASASTYKNALEYFGLLKGTSDWNKDCVLIGCTATPNRNDNQGIDKIFDKVAFNYGIIDAIQDNWLSRIKAYRVDTDTSLEGVKTHAGDFAIGELADRVNNHDRNGLIIKAYQDFVNGKQALCFSAGVAHAEALAKAFNDAGIKADYVLGTTPKIERADKLVRFHKKEIQVMVNAMVLTEGYDNDNIEAILMARPTQSSILFQQMIGRGTRKSEGKDFLTIIDFTDNTYRNRLQTTASLLGLEGRVNFRGQDIIEAKVEIDKLFELNPYMNADRIDMDKIKYLIEEVDLMSGLRVPTEVAPYTTYDWHRFGEESFRIGFGDYRYLVIKKSLTNEFTLTYYKWDKETKIESKTELATLNILEEAIRKGDGFIDENYADTIPLVSLHSRWRLENPSENQITTLRKLGVNQSILDQVNKGEASRLLSKLFALQAQKRA